MDWWIFVQFLILALFAYIITAMSCMTTNALLAIIGVPILIIIAICLVYWRGDEESVQECNVVPVPQEETPLYLREAEEVADVAWLAEDRQEEEI